MLQKNKKAQSKSFELIKILDKRIASRNAIYLITKRIKKKNTCVTFDFKDIKFISRSASQALLKFKNEFEDHSFFTFKKCAVEFINMEPEVKKMIKLAKSPKKKTRKEK